MAKGQAHMMEYVFMTLFIVIIISILIFFLMGWQFTQIRSADTKIDSDKALYLMKFFIKSPYLTRDESLFDEAKMSVFTDMQEDDLCERMNVVFGRDWFARVYYLGGSDRPCTTLSDYGSCNYWSFCEQAGRASFSFMLPVNIYRNSDDTVHMGVLEVGVYHEESPE
jgi:hypothetical protein